MANYDKNACDDYNYTINRRQLMGASAATLAASAAGVALLGGVAKKAAGKTLGDCPPLPTSGNHVFIFLHLAGGADTLGMITPPLGPGTTYDALRGGTAVELTSAETMPLHSGSNDYFRYVSELDVMINGNSSLDGIWSDGKLVISPATSLPNQSYSHFQATDWLSRMLEGDCGDQYDGFLARFLNTTSGTTNGRLRGLSISPGILGPLANSDPSNIRDTLAINDLCTSGIGGLFDRTVSCLLNSEPERREKLLQMYDAQLSYDAWPGIALATACSVDTLQNAVDCSQPIPAGYDPTHPLDVKLMNLARLLKSNSGNGIGVQVVALEYGGWDTHNNQKSRMLGANGLVANLARALTSFYNDMKDCPVDFTLASVTEFGRNLDPGGSTGTEHGHGGPAFIFGSNINGGPLALTQFGNIPGVAGPWGVSGYDALDHLHDVQSTECTGSRDICGLVDPRDLLVEIFDENMNANVTQLFEPAPTQCAYEVSSATNYGLII